MRINRNEINKSIVKNRDKLFNYQNYRELINLILENDNIEIVFLINNIRVPKINTTYSKDDFFSLLQILKIKIYKYEKKPYIEEAISRRTLKIEKYK